MVNTLISGPILPPSPIFFSQVLPLLVRHCSKLSSYKIYRNKLEKMTKKKEIWPDFGLFGPNFGPTIFFEGFISSS